MTFLEFRKQLFDLACFNIYQVYAWQPDFDRNNLTRWVKKAILSDSGRGILLFQNIRANLIIPFMLPIGSMPHPISACTRLFRSME